MNKMIEVIKAVIALNEATYERMQNYMKTQISGARFNREFRTVHINAGRRTGKTFAMCNLARKDDLIVVHNQDTKERLMHDYPDCLAAIGTISEMTRPINRGTYRSKPKFDYVWIDEFDICEDIQDTNQLYYTIDANLFIKLGE